MQWQSQLLSVTSTRLRLQTMVTNMSYCSDLNLITFLRFFFKIFQTRRQFTSVHMSKQDDEVGCDLCLFFCKMAEISGIFNVKQQVLRQLETYSNSIIQVEMDTLSKKGYCVNCAWRFIDQQTGLPSVEKNLCLKI